ncbi:MAG: glycosyltransferase family 39 protein [Planctomycetaceae bacterium]
MFGFEDWAARLIPTFAGLVTILATYLYGTRALGHQASRLGTNVLILSLGFLYCSRFLVLDGLLTMFVTLSLYCAHLSIADRRFHRGYWAGAAVTCGLGLLTKGPVAMVLLLPPLVAYAWISDRLRLLTFRRWVGFLAIVAVIAGPWFAVLLSRNPEFARHFFWDHNIRRFFAGSFHERPIWYYVPVLFLGGMPWALLMIPLAGFLFRRGEADRSQRPEALGFLLLAASWCVAFFSISKGSYPVHPARRPAARTDGRLPDRPDLLAVLADHQ